MTISLLTYQKIFDEIIVNRDKKKIVHSPCQILFAYTSAVPLKLQDKFDVTDHDQKVDDIVTPPDLSSVFKRKLAKIQSLIIDLFHNGGLLTYYFYAYDY